MEAIPYGGMPFSVLMQGSLVLSQLICHPLLIPKGDSDPHLNGEGREVDGKEGGGGREQEERREGKLC